MSLRRTHHSSRWVLSTVMRLYVWSRNLVNEETIARVGLQHHTTKILCCSNSINTTIIITDNNTNNNDSCDAKQQCRNRAKLANLTCSRAIAIYPPLSQLTAQIKSHLNVISFSLLGLPSGYFAACFLNRTGHELFAYHVLCTYPVYLNF